MNGDDLPAGYSVRSTPQQAPPPAQPDDDLPPGYTVRSMPQQGTPNPSLLEKLQQTWPARLARSIYEGVTLPGDVATGKVDPLSDEAVRRSFDLAQLVAPMTPGLRAGEGILGVPQTAAAYDALGRPRPLDLPARQDGVVLSAGQASGDPVQLAFENKARSGVLGEKIQQQALAFDEQQARQVAGRTEAARVGFDPQGRVLAETPREAAETAQQAVQQQAVRADEATDQLFARARNYDTQIEADIFRNMGTGIRQDIYEGVEGGERVIVDSSNTPHAHAMIQDLNRQPEALARRLGQRIAEGDTIAALPLEMVDRIRRTLSGLRRGAAAAARGGRYEDLRASQAVLDAFDARIDQAIDRGLYSGDPAGVQAWRDARAAHTGYREAFTRFSRDPTSKMIEQVVGTETTAALIPEKVAEHIYGSNVLKPTTENVQAARRFQRMLDPEQWSAVQQGHYQKLLESSPDNRTIAKNIDTFLGHSMANVIYTPAQRDMLRVYAELRRTIGSKATVGAPLPVQRMSDRILQHFTGATGAALGGAMGEAIGTFFGHPHIFGVAGVAVGRFAGEKIGAARPAARDARRIERDMRVIGKSWEDYIAAVRSYERAKTARSIARLSLAVRNFDKNLRSVGTTFQEMSEPAPQQQPQQQPQTQQTPAPAQRPIVTVPLPGGVMSGAPLQP